MFQKRSVFGFFILFTCSTSVFAGPFDSRRCGTHYPKKPTAITAATFNDFQSTDEFGITSKFRPMVCRGGRGLVVKQIVTLNSGTPIQFWFQNALEFQPASVAAGTDGATLKAGECSWADAAIGGTGRKNLTDSIYYRSPTIELTTRADATGRLVKEMEMTPDGFQTLIQSNGLFLFFVSPYTYQTLPFCDSRPLGVVALPYLHLR